MAFVSHKLHRIKSHITMRIFLLLLAVASLWGCSDNDDEALTSAVGEWSYTTPDGKIGVIFDLAGGDNQVWDIQNEVIFVDGVQGKANKEISNTTLSTIGRIRINANDVALVSAFNITFEELTIREDFTAIDVKKVTYSWPISTLNTLDDVVITRNR